MKLLIEQALHTTALLGNTKQIVLFSTTENKKNKIVAKVIGVCTEGKFTTPIKKLVNIMDTPLRKVISTKQSFYYSSQLIKQLLPFPIPDDINRKCLCLPLLTEKKQKLKGIIILFQKTDTVSADKALPALNALSPMIAAILEAAQKNANLQQLATNNPLTGLYTWHYLEIRLLEELTRIHRYGGKVSLLMIDIDNFKQVNNACGTKDSTLIIQEVIKLLNTLIRNRIDLLCNYNTKQFAILLSNTGVDDACILAERLRKQCEYRLFMTRQGVPIKMTLSIGIAHDVGTAYIHNSTDKNSKSKTTDSVNENLTKQIIHHAKTMLQVAKQAGCNKVMAWW